MGVRDSLIPFLTISAGLFGALFAKGMQWYMSDYDFPLMVGGKPLFSLHAFVPVTFELFVLLAALTTFAVLMVFFSFGLLEGLFQSELLKAAFSYMNLWQHMEEFSRGVVDTRRLVYYTSVTLFFLFLSARSLEAKKWR